MPTRRWDDRWARYPESVPLPAEDGIATSKQRGAMASTWWSRRFVDVLESYGLGTRMQRGRRYARSGQVVSLDVRSALLLAQVQGSRRTPYVVSITAAAPTAEQWAHVDTELSARVSFVAQLMAGEVPPDLEAVFDAAKVALFPATWSVLGSTCSCPDWENPCKHIAATLYVFADQLDADPWLLLAWRGRTREQMLEALRVPVGRSEISSVAPWWPFAEGPLPTGLSSATVDSLGDPPDDPAAVLARLEPLPVDVRTTPVTDLLRTAYTAMAEPDDLPL
jgi:uncharacterized Zn finger protein